MRCRAQKKAPPEGSGAPTSKAQHLPPEISQRLAAVLDLMVARPPPSRATMNEALQMLAGICLSHSGASP